MANTLFSFQKSEMFVLFATILYFLISESAALIGEGVQNRIFKGVAAKDGQYPFMVFIITGYTRPNHSICSGSLIKLDTILTAAHCLHTENPYYEYKPREIVVAVGRAELDHYAVFRMPNPMNKKYHAHRGMLQESIASQLFMHPMYEVHDDYDVGIIKIAKPFESTRYVATIKYTTREFTGGTTCYVLGYGLNHHEYMGILYFYTTQKIKNNMNKCGQISNNRLYCHKVESMSEPGGCEGDSGGPMLCNSLVYGVYSSDIEFMPINPNISECGQPFIKTFAKLSASEKAHSFVTKFAELLESKSCTINVPLPFLFLLLNILLLLYNKYES